MDQVVAALRGVRAIARVTFFEILRDKVLSGAIVLSGVLLFLGLLVSRASFIRPDRILLDFGLLAFALSGGFLGVLSGAVALAREFERRTIFIALARPISRSQFLCGKYFGVALVLLLNSLVLALVFVGVLKLLAPDSALVGRTLVQALGLLAVQALFLAAISLFFSTFSTVSLSAVMAIGLYLVGVNVSQIRLLLVRMDEGSLRHFLEGLVSMLPNFEHFNVGLIASYGQELPAGFFAVSVSYAFAWIAGLLLLGGIFIERKDA